MKRPADSNLAQRLFEARKNANLTLEDEARAIGVSKGTIWQYEHGDVHVPADRLTDIARAVGCDIREFHNPPGSPFRKSRNKFRPPPRIAAAPELKFLRLWAKYHYDQAMLGK